MRSLQDEPLSLWWDGCRGAPGKYTGASLSRPISNTCGYQSQAHGQVHQVHSAARRRSSEARKPPRPARAAVAA